MTDENRFAQTPKPPYFAVIFSSSVTGTDPDGYKATADRMIELAAEQDGFLGIESTRDEAGFGITVSFWRDQDAIRRWFEVPEHQEAQKAGKAKWYDHYSVRICQVERNYETGAR